MKSNILVLLMITFSMVSCSQNQKAQNKCNSGHGIIPAPAVVDYPSGNEDSKISEIKVFIDEELNSTYLSKLISESTELSKVNTESMANVNISIDPNLASESYKLNIQKDQIEITAADKTGIQYAMVSLCQMINHCGFPLPVIQITDSPQFSYRGMHLDVARHFFSVDEVKKYLDYMAYYKFNNFHWHLTEDQGWRIEIKKYPKLQEIAAFRKETLIGHYSDQPHKFDGKRYGGYYTQDEIKDVVAYAAARNINVIPEIEMPGHAQAALAAYPELGCGPGPYEVATKWGIFEDVFCPNEITFKFLEDVIDEVITLFPGKYIHIGGDECPKTAWKNSAFCQKLMKEKGIKDEHELQSYFITRMEKYINSKGKQIIGWDEILEGGLAPNATVMSWRGIAGGLEAARSSHDVIMTPGTHCYFDHYQSESPNEPLAIGGYTSVEKVYHWNPVPEALEADKHKYILGGQANVWTEYIPEFKNVEYMAFARGMAMSEALWTKDKNYKEFVLRYEKHNQFWKDKGANMAFHLYDLIPDISAGTDQSISVKFNLPEGSEIELELDGKKIGAYPPNEMININRSGLYKFTGKKGKITGNPLVLEFDLHKATSATITLDNLPSVNYPGNGPGSLINGVLGSNNKHGGTEWLGFNGKDCSGVLDFKKKDTLNEITFRFFKGEGQWIYLPKNIEISVSDDGQVFTTLIATDKITADKKVATVTLPLNGIKSRFLKFEIKNYGKIPKGAQGAGNNAWLFVDEIVVR